MLGDAQTGALMSTAQIAAIQKAIDRAAALLGPDPARAEAEIRAVLTATPKDPRALLILASARRRQGFAKDAKALLEPLARAFPKAALTQYELGLCQAATGDAAAAAAALRAAIAANPDLADAWKALGDLLFAEGDVAGAQDAFAQQARAAVTDPKLKPAALALYRKDFATAERLLREHLATTNETGPALRLLGEVFLRQERFDDAETVFARAVRLEPDHAGGRFSYASALFRQQNAALALPIVEDLLAKRPDEAAYLNLQAALLSLVGDDDKVIAIYEGLLQRYPKQAPIWLNHAHALKTVGRQADALAAYRRCIALAPQSGDAWWGLANLKLAVFDGTDIAAMTAQLARPGLALEDKLNLHFALGKAAEDAGDYDRAFVNYAQGAALRRAQRPYDADGVTQDRRRAETVFTPAFFAERREVGDASPDPIFIIGLPRSGSTLIEQILASHSKVQGTMELPTLGLIAQTLDKESRGQGGRGLPDALATLPQHRFGELGAKYLEGAAIYRRGDEPLFIDKMPNNFRHIGLLHLILPRARIIDARRHPMASCFSAFKQHFAQGQGFSYDLTDLGRYYADYVALMGHIDQVLPGRVHRVIYEDLVENVEAEVRRLLDYCCLDFEPACLTFYENTRAVRTVSSEQVRRPIYREGLDHWKRFEPHLGPLKAGLGDALHAWRG